MPLYSVLVLYRHINALTISKVDLAIYLENCLAMISLHSSEQNTARSHIKLITFYKSLPITLMEVN